MCACVFVNKQMRVGTLADALLESKKQGNAPHLVRHFGDGRDGLDKPVYILAGTGMGAGSNRPVIQSSGGPMIRWSGDAVVR